MPGSRALVLTVMLALFGHPNLANAERASLPAGPAAPRTAEPSAAVSLAHHEQDLAADESLRIYLLTMGPGDHPFFKFGHNAIWVHSNHGDAVYNFGTFGFDSPWLILDFLQGKLTYWLSVDSLRMTLAAYGAENRGIIAQELRLTPTQRLEISRALIENAREENRCYEYDYYRDNCSTRVRDVIDKVVLGRLQKVGQAPASLTWREHTLRLTADNLPVYFGLHVIMGSLIDQKITFWDEMFLPEKLQQAVSLATVPSATGDVPLVATEHVLLTADRAPTRLSPPHWLMRFAAVGVVLGALSFALMSLATRGRAWRLIASTVLALFGLVCGSLGTIFVCMWAFTDHEAAYHNENILQLAPWSLLLVLAALRLWRQKANGFTLAQRTLQAAVVASVVGLGLKLLPWFDQQNAEFIALMLPLWSLLLAAVTRWKSSRSWASFT